MSRRATPRENGRELHALVLACVWVLGIEAFPLHHSMTHGSLGPHVHADATHVHEDAPDPSLASFGRTPRRHGAGSLAHKQLLFSAPPSPVPGLSQALFAYTLEPIAVPALESSARSAPTRARGPPLA